MTETLIQEIELLKQSKPKWGVSHSNHYLDAINDAVSIIRQREAPLLDKHVKEPYLHQNILEALIAARIALMDFGACQDPQCTEPNCAHALVKINAILGRE